MKAISSVRNKASTVLIRISGIIVIGIGLTALIGWTQNTLLLASFYVDLIPMAPSTASFFVISGIILFYFESISSNRLVKVTTLSIIIILIINAIILMWYSMRGEYFRIEYLGLNINNSFNGVPVGHMSPVTAFCFIFSSISILFLLINNRKNYRLILITLISGLVVLIISFILLLAYFYGTPLMYGNESIPPAISTSIAFFILSIVINIMTLNLPGPGIALSISFRNRNSLPLIIIFLIFASGILVSGYFYVKNFENKYKIQITNQITSIAELKARDISNWRNERLQSAKLFTNNPDFISHFKNYISNPMPGEDFNKINEFITLALHTYHYNNISVYDTLWRERISVPNEQGALDSGILKTAISAVSTLSCKFHDIYVDKKDGNIYLNLIIPVLDHSRSTRVIGILNIRIDPNVSLSPLIHDWPVTSNSEETFLVRKSGDFVVYLNDLRFQKKSALNLKYPLSNFEKPSVKAALGMEGVVDGYDYKNTHIIACIKPISDSPWKLISGIDVDEIYSSLRERLWITIVLIAILLLASGALLGTLWREIRMKYYREKLKDTLHIYKLNRIYALLSNINQAIVRIRQPSRLFDKVTSIVVEVGGFTAGWIGLVKSHDLNIEIVSSAGKTGNYLKTLFLNIEADEERHAPFSRALREHKPIIINNLSKEVSNSSWKKNAEQMGFRSSASFPLMIGNKVIGVIILCSDETDFFNETEIKLLTELSMDISFALEFAEKEIARKKGEEAVKASEERYHGTLDKMIEGCQIIGEDWRYLYLNNTAAFQSHIKKEDLLGKTMMECFPGIEESEMFKNLKKCMIEKRTLRMENEFIYPDESRSWFDLIMQPVPEGVFILSLDITDRKLIEFNLLESKATLSRAQSLAHIGSWKLDIGTNTLNWSDEIYKIFNVPAGTLITYELFLSYIHPEDREMVIKASKEALNGVTYDIEHRILVNGEIKWVREQAEIIFDHYGKAAQRIGTVQDITLRKQSEDKINILNFDLEKKIEIRTGELQESNKELEAFAYSISHDLRAPLRSIIGYSNILQEEFGEKINDEGRRVINTIIKNTKRMGDLIDDLLEFSRLGRKNIIKNHIDVNVMVNEIVKDLKEEEKGRNIEIIINKLHPCKADRNMIQQVWINLISNALKYTRRESDARIEISSIKKGDVITYSIRDNGCGFNMKYVDKLFGVFQRLHTMDEFEGTGVGLALIKRIVTRHGGTVAAEGMMGEGATFSFSLGI